jgi:hypothetical protein
MVEHAYIHNCDGTIDTVSVVALPSAGEERRMIFER